MPTGSDAADCLHPGELRGGPSETYRYWPFRNTCSTPQLVSVCAVYATGPVVLAVEVPSRGSADVQIANTPPPTKLSWKPGPGIQCR